MRESKKQEKIENMFDAKSGINIAFFAVMCYITKTIEQKTAGVR